MTDTSRAPTDYGDTPWAKLARERKAVEIEAIAREAHKTSHDIIDPDIREKIVAVLSAKRGKRTGASNRTWARVWHFMRDAEHLPTDGNPFESSPPCQDYSVAGTRRLDMDALTGEQLMDRL